MDGKKPEPKSVLIISSFCVLYLSDFQSSASLSSGQLLFPCFLTSIPLPFFLFDGSTLPLNYHLLLSLKTTPLGNNC